MTNGIKVRIIKSSEITRAPYRLYWWSDRDDEGRREFGTRFPYCDYVYLREARHDAAKDPESVSIVDLRTGKEIDNFCTVTGDNGPVDLRLGE